MLEWILNPYGIDLGAYVVLWVAMLIIIPVALIVGVVKAFSGRHDDDR
jgi:hypothetical protein